MVTFEDQNQYEIDSSTQTSTFYNNNMKYIILLFQVFAAFPKERVIHFTPLTSVLAFVQCNTNRIEALTVIMWFCHSFPSGERLCVTN